MYSLSFGSPFDHFVGVAGAFFIAEEGTFLLPDPSFAFFIGEGVLLRLDPPDPLRLRTPSLIGVVLLILFLFTADILDTYSASASLS